MKKQTKGLGKIQRPPILTDKTQKLVTALQKELNLPLLVYWVSTGGSICQNDVAAMSRLLGHSSNERPVGLVSLRETCRQVGLRTDLYSLTIPYVSGRRNWPGRTKISNLACES